VQLMPLFNFFLLQIKRLDPVTKKVTTIAGTGRAGYKDGPALSAQVRDHSTNICCLQFFYMRCIFILKCGSTLISILY
jgi:hypothetical protein